METRLDRRPNLRDQVYEIVKRMIVLQEIAPGGKINEEDLAERIGVSRTPIRETLCRLDNEGIVKIVPRRGAFVVKQSQETVIEILQVREVLEGLVARLASENMDERMLRRLRRALEDISGTPDDEEHLTKYTRADIEFHAILLECARNRMLQSMMAVVNAHLQIIRLRTVVLPGRAKRTVEEHHEILKAIDGRDAPAAEALMRRHVASVRHDAMENIDAML
jgi:DNA-binding GntR family transcriptional regulator